jgi:ElaB/YqjD/DUF883 family membrane-anchored ribosome-binding protein
MDLNAQNQDSGTSTAKTGDLQGTAASIVHDVLEGAQSAADKVKPVVSKMPHAAQAPLYQAVHAAADAAASIEDKAGDLIERESAMLESATGYVRANPRRAIGIAFVAGFLVARILL